MLQRLRTFACYCLLLDADGAGGLEGHLDYYVLPIADATLQQQQYRPTNSCHSMISTPHHLQPSICKPLKPCKGIFTTSSSFSWVFVVTLPGMQRRACQLLFKAFRSWSTACQLVAFPAACPAAIACPLLV
jgi:hypothetical protein